MNPTPGVIHFSCQSCGIPLTVPLEMAGVTGPCPQCRTNITSPHATPAPQANPFAPIPQAGFNQPYQPPAPAPSVPAPMSQQAAAAAWNQGTGPNVIPRSPVGGGMVGASWPPNASASSAPASGGGQHPVMDRLLQKPSSAPSGIPPYQDRGNPTARRRVSSSRDSGRRGAMWLAFFMAIMALGGTSWFFRDQLKTAWLTYTLKEDEEAPVEVPPLPSDSTSPSGSAPSKFDPTSDPQSKALPTTSPPSNQPPPPPNSPLSAATPPLMVLPALPATAGNLPSAPAANVPPPPAPANSSLVEVASPPSPGPPVNVVEHTPSAPAMIVGVTPESQPALDALQKFFQAKTWQERLPLVQVPGAMQPIMEKYYANNPDGALYPSNIQLIRYDKAPETGPPHCVFQVAGGGLKQPLPIMVEITDDGWKVDWLTFTEFKDELLQKFLEAPQPEPARFHVLMRRAHYFDDDVPSLDKKTCFQVMPPMPGFNGDVFAQKGSSIARELDKQLGWEVSQAAAVVELQWRNEDRRQWVELTNLVQLNWRNSEPTAPKAVPVEDDPPTPAPAPKKK